MQASHPCPQHAVLVCTPKPAAPGALQQLYVHASVRQRFWRAAFVHADPRLTFAPCCMCVAIMHALVYVVAGLPAPHHTMLCGP